jgi:hypothetical protein
MKELNPRAKLTFILGIKEYSISDLQELDEDVLNNIDTILFELPNGTKVEVGYRRTDGYFSISARDMEIIPRASNLIYLKDSGKRFY